MFSYLIEAHSSKRVRDEVPIIEVSHTHSYKQCEMFVEKHRQSKDADIIALRNYIVSGHKGSGKISKSVINSLAVLCSVHLEEVERVVVSSLPSIPNAVFKREAPKAKRKTAEGKSKDVTFGIIPCELFSIYDVLFEYNDLGGPTTIRVIATGEEEAKEYVLAKLLGHPVSIVTTEHVCDVVECRVSRKKTNGAIEEIRVDALSAKGRLPEVHYVTHWAQIPSDVNTSNIKGGRISRGTRRSRT